MWSKRQFKLFVSFLVFGVLLGLIENLIAISFATNNSLDLTAFVISLLVVIPFAAIGELIVDRTSLIPRAKGFLLHVEVFLEFFVFGLVMGIVEDLIVISLLTGQAISFDVVAVVFLVTLPFAILGEVVVDRSSWFSYIKNVFS